MIATIGRFRRDGGEFRTAVRRTKKRKWTRYRYYYTYWSGEVFRYIRTTITDWNRSWVRPGNVIRTILERTPRAIRTYPFLQSRRFSRLTRNFFRISPIFEFDSAEDGPYLKHFSEIPLIFFCFFPKTKISKFPKALGNAYNFHASLEKEKCVCHWNSNDFGNFWAKRRTWRFRSFGNFCSFRFVNRLVFSLENRNCNASSKTYFLICG